jgi:hypothetical protein
VILLLTPFAGDGGMALVFVAADQAVEHSDRVVGGRVLTWRQQSFTEELAIVPPESGRVSIRAIVTDTGGNLTEAVAKFP